MLLILCVNVWLKFKVVLDNSCRDHFSGHSVNTKYTIDYSRVNSLLRKLSKGE